MTQVTCEQARLQMCADQRTPSAQLREHLAECEDCRTYESGMAVLEAGLRRAFALPVPLPPPRPSRALTPAALPLPLPQALPHVRATTRPPVRSRGPLLQPRLWAMATSVVVAAVGAVLLWTVHASDSLAQELFTHVSLEPKSWTLTDAAPPETIQKVMQRAHLELTRGQDRVVFARTCFVHGHLVPHLVVRTAQGPVAVVVMPDEPASANRSFHVGNVTGLVLPAPRGSIAVFTQQDVLSLDVAQALKGEVRWLPDARP